MEDYKREYNTNLLIKNLQYKPDMAFKEEKVHSHEAINNVS